MSKNYARFSNFKEIFSACGRKKVGKCQKTMPVLVISKKYLVRVGVRKLGNVKKLCPF